MATTTVSLTTCDRCGAEMPAGSAAELDALPAVEVHVLGDAPSREILWRDVCAPCWRDVERLVGLLATPKRSRGRPRKLPAGPAPKRTRKAKAHPLAPPPMAEGGVE